MPNWCENVLTVTGSKRAIAEFKKKVKVSPHAFLDSLVPTPADIVNTNGWHTDNWGTKWDVDVRIDSDEPTCLQYSFESAWAPPEEWLRSVGPMFPNLCFHLWYAEGGMGFAGTCTVENTSVSTEDLDYVTAQIQQYGIFHTLCEYCDGEIELDDAGAPRICEDCANHRCSRCRKLDSEHVEGKCLFDSSLFIPLGGA